MSLNGFYYYPVWAFAENTTFTESGTINLASNYVRATVMLQEVSQSGTVQAAISEYVQNGTPHHGSWQEIAGPGITSVTFGLMVSNAAGQATLNVDIFN